MFATLKRMYMVTLAAPVASEKYFAALIVLELVAGSPGAKRSLTVGQTLYCVHACELALGVISISRCWLEYQLNAHGVASIQPKCEQPLGHGGRRGASTLSVNSGTICIVLKQLPVFCSCMCSVRPR